MAATTKAGIPPAINLLPKATINRLVAHNRAIAIVTRVATRIKAKVAAQTAADAVGVGAVAGVGATAIVRTKATTTSRITTLAIPRKAIKSNSQNNHLGAGASSALLIFVTP